MGGVEVPLFSWREQVIVCSCIDSPGQGHARALDVYGYRSIFM